MSGRAGVLLVGVLFGGGGCDPGPPGTSDAAGERPPGVLEAGASCARHADCRSGLVCGFAAFPTGDQWAPRTCKPARLIGPKDAGLLTGVATGQIFALSGGEYSALSLSTSAEVYGPDEGGAAILQKADGPAVTVNAGGRLLLAFVTVRGALVGARCDSGAAIALHQVHVQQSQREGLIAEQCEVIVRASSFTEGRGGALRFDAGTRFTVVDSRVSGNSAKSQAAVQLAPSLSGALRGVCLLNNQNEQGSGALNCGDGDAISVQETELRGNSLGRNGQQFYGSCRFIGVPKGCP